MNDTTCDCGRQYPLTKNRIAKIKDSQITVLTQYGSFSAVIMFLRIVSFADKNGVCKLPKRTLMTISLLPRTTAYEAIGKLIEMGLLSAGMHNHLTVLDDAE